MTIDFVCGPSNNIMTRVKSINRCVSTDRIRKCPRARANVFRLSATTSDRTDGAVLSVVGLFYFNVNEILKTDDDSILLTRHASCPVRSIRR